MLSRASSAGALRCTSSRKRKCALATAASLVVKPSTPPVVKPSTPPQQEVRTKVSCNAAEVRIEVRSLGGELVTDGNFQLSECVMAVEERIRAVRQVPCHKQRLIWQDQILNSHCRLEDLKLPAEGAIFLLQIKTGPSDQELALISEAKQVVAEGCRHLSGLLGRNNSWSCCPDKGNLAVKLVCQATMHLLAGHTKCIDIHRNGNPKDDSWVGITKMLQDPYFLEKLLDLPSIIEQDKLKAKRVHACLNHVQDISGHSDSEKIVNLRNTGSIFGASLLGYLFAIVKYYDMISPMLSQAGVDALREVVDSHNESCAAADFSARHVFLICFQEFPRGQECSRDALARLLMHLHARERMTSMEA